jgi:hypothetical protein
MKGDTPKKSSKGAVRNSDRKRTKVKRQTKKRRGSLK